MARLLIKQWLRLRGMVLR